MKKFAPLFVAAALVLPAAGFRLVHAQDGGDPGRGCEHGGPGGRHGGRGDHHGGPGGHHGDPAARVEHRARMLTAILDLDARQQAEVRRILQAAETEFSTLHQQGRSEATRQAMEQLHTRTKQQIAGVLNATQRATFERVEAVHEAERTERRAEREARRGEGGGGGAR